MKVSIREREVLRLIAYEYTSKEISNKLSISNHTVISHRQNLIEKLGVRNTAGLIRRARLAGEAGLRTWLPSYLITLQSLR